jgi:hypothetical protein
LDRHEVLGFAGHRRRNLASPHCEQSAGNAIAPRHLGDVRLLLKALRRDPGLLIAGPPSPPALPGDHLDATIRVTFLPGIKHGIYHRFTSTHQIMPGYIPGKPCDDEVEASCRLLLIRIYTRSSQVSTVTRDRRQLRVRDGDGVHHAIVYQLGTKLLGQDEASKEKASFKAVEKFTSKMRALRLSATRAVRRGGRRI